MAGLVSPYIVYMHLVQRTESGKKPHSQWDPNDPRTLSANEPLGISKRLGAVKSSSL